MHARACTQSDKDTKNLRKCNSRVEKVVEIRVFREEREDREFREIRELLKFPKFPKFLISAPTPLFFGRAIALSEIFTIFVCYMRVCVLAHSVHL